jgi:hypothetical protein
MIAFIIIEVTCGLASVVGWAVSDSPGMALLTGMCSATLGATAGVSYGQRKDTPTAEETP